ncbi:MAG: tyrosine-protein kinase family protein [Candidatus Hodarchaeota archaeon]
MASGKNTKIIIVHSYKGGTGKTAISVNLARFLAIKKGKKVLLVEQDTRGPSFENIFKIEPVNFWNDFYTTYAVSFKEIAIKSHDLDIICSKGEEIEIPRNEDINSFYARQLQRLKRQKGWLFSEGIDYLIFDTRPGYSRELVNNLIITDTAVLITRLDADTVTKTIDMYEQIYSQFKQRKILVVQNQVPAPLKGVVTTEMDSDVKKTLEVWESFTEGKDIINIPYTDEIAYTLFISKIAPFNSSFMNYIENIADRI